MKKIYTIILSLLLVFAIGSNVNATLFTFGTGPDDLWEHNPDNLAGGSASATMNFSVDENTLSVTLDNTSSIYLEDGTIGNAPGITGFGFNFSNNDLLTLTSWTLDALDITIVDGVEVKTTKTIGGTNSTGDWVMDDNKIAGVSLNYLPTTDKDQMKGALYNPEAAGYESLLAALPNYFTTATLKMEFDNTPLLEFVSNESPFVRMQNVGGDTNGDGESGDGSLKLYGTETNNPIPEPATMVLLGSGLLGLGWTGRRKIKK